MRLTASSLRADVYRILDQILETGVPVLIERRGKMLKIVPVEAASKLDNLKPRPYLAADPEELVSLDWSDEWDGEGALEAEDGKPGEEGA